MKILSALAIQTNYAGLPQYLYISCWLVLAWKIFASKCKIPMSGLTAYVWILFPMDSLVFW